MPGGGRKPQDFERFELSLRSLGSAIETVRTSQHLTQEDLAALSGISGTYVGEIERGRKFVSLPMVLLIARALKVPVSQLVAGLEAMVDRHE